MIYSYKFLLLHTILILLSFAGYQLLVNLKDFKDTSKLKKFLFVPSDKSSNGAVLLGGLVYSVVTFSAFIILLWQYKCSPNERILMYAWIASHTILTLFGYLDDKYELRASVKLVGQALPCFVFAFTACMTIESNTSAIYLSVFFIWGMGVVNGSNLLDGIDTISVKLSLTTYLLFFVIGILFSIQTLPVMTIVFAIPMIAFYFFNKEPSKIHLGEIGGTTIGLSYLVLAAITFNGMYAEKSYFNFTNAICLSLMPLHLPMAELGVSFLRRIYKRKSPFIGDRHHIHYIFRDFYNLGATKTATLYAFGHFSICGVMFLFSPFSPVLSFFIGGGFYLLCFFSVGKEFWSKKEVSQNVPFLSIFRSVKKKEINVINSSDINKFQIEIITEHESDEDQIKKAS
jgi:UDP-GlcNAc:undecaprenyl-phosphate GlcNAc-1-phosphate transferase